MFIYKPKELFEKINRTFEGKNFSEKLFKFAENITNQSKAFFKREFQKGDYLITVFSYRYPSYREFKELNAFELRGLTFVKSPEGEFSHFLAMHKFFNINENEDYKIDRLKKLKLLSASEKLDGSLVHPIKVGDQIFMKSRHDLESYPAQRANILLQQRENLKNLVKDLFSQNLQPLFEYVAPQNQIVVPYKEENLYLVQLRNNLTGEYLSDEELTDLAKEYNIPTPKRETVSFEELLKRAKNTTQTEGWVLRFENDLFAKLKTKWYLKRHKILSNLSEDIIIRKILRREIDDILPLLLEDSLTYQKIVQIKEVLENYLNRTLEELSKSAKSGNFYFIEDPTLRRIAEKCSQSRDIEKCIQTALRNLLLNQIQNRKKALEFLERIKA
jgi:RNA ligase